MLELAYGKSDRSICYSCNGLNPPLNSTRSYENLYVSKLIKTAINTAITVKLLKSKVTLNTCENVKMSHETQRDLGNKSKVNETSYSETCHNLSTETRKQNSTTLPKCNNTHARIVKEVLPSTCPYNNFSRSRSRSKNLTHVKSRDREPSRIPVKKLVHLMSKNRKSRRVIKRFIKQSIPKSSCFHNLLSTRYRKDVIHFQQQTNAYMWKFRGPFHAIKSKRIRSRRVVHKQLSMSMHNQFGKSEKQYKAC
jgi:hypothetical protein